MSLLEEAMTKCVMLNKQSDPDGYGGIITTWTNGAEFSAAMTSLYTIITKKNITLEYHDVIKRVSDGKIFRITSDGDDKHTPKSAALDMREVSAEEWEVPREN